MPAKNIVIGQRVASDKIQLAKELRRRMTPEEKILWQCLRGNRLGGFHFRRQQVIDGYIVDLYCHAAGLIVETDGSVHEQQVEYDQQRDETLSARGLRILRIKNAEVRHSLTSVLARIAAACREGAAQT
jgi:very-short-patch-repair endonuclease